jgi:uncharacterized protein (TIRG00374 family)
MWKKVSAILIPTLIAVLLIGFMLARVWDELLTAIQHAVPVYLVLAVVICLGAWTLRGFRYRYIVRRLGTEISITFSTACIFLSQTANLILPARLGDFVRMFVLRHEKEMAYTNSFTSIIAERVFDIVIIAVLGLCTLSFLITIVPEWFADVILFVLGLGAVLVIFLLVSKRFTSENRILKKILEILEQFRTVAATVPAVTTLSASSALIWIGDTIICYLVALMFHAEVPFLLVLLAIVIGNLVKAVPVTPGGIGTYELALVVTFELGGVPAAVATLIAVVDHLIKNLITLAGGVASIYYFGDWVVSLLKRLFKGDTGEYGSD